MSAKPEMPSKAHHPSVHWTSDEDIDQDVKLHRAKKHTWPMFFGLAYRCIGVIYGDLGTSPLYTYPTVFSREPSELAIYGSCCLIMYILILEVFVKYLFITLYADDKDEGGTFAIYSLLCRRIGITPFGEAQKFAEEDNSEDEDFDPQLYLDTEAAMKKDDHLDTEGQQKRLLRRWEAFKHRYPRSQSKLGARTSNWLKGRIKGSRGLQQLLLIFVLWGIAMFLGDGVMTCAIEVVSAIAGLQIKVPSISTGVVVGVSSAILVGLFMIQFLGTSRIGILFSPVLLLWFFVNTCFGIYNIAKFEPAIFKCFNPAYAFRYLVVEGKDAWLSLGGIILCVTGCESLFSDLGHFSRPAVQFSTLTVVLPACLVTYLGEAAYMLKNPSGYTNPYFYALPQWAFWPVLVIATAASIVSAQSLISATFSIISQSVTLNCFPALKIVRTSEHVAGQVYVPFVNWGLMIGSIAVTCGFQTTVSLGHAFGFSFISVMLVTTTLVTLVQMIVWKWNPFLSATIMTPLFLLEFVCFTSLSEKVPQGAWFPLGLGVIVLAIEYLWHYGASQRFKYACKNSSRLEHLIRREHPDSTELVIRDNSMRVLRVPGLALYYTENIRSVPGAFRRLLYKTPVLHRTVVFITVRQVPLPFVKEHQRLLVAVINFPGFYQVIARYGYRETIDHGPAFIEQITAKIEEISEFLKRGSGQSSPRLQLQRHNLAIDGKIPAALPPGSEAESGYAPDPRQGTVPMPKGPQWSPGQHDDWDSVRSLADSEAPLLKHPGEVELSHLMGRIPQEGVVYFLSRSIVHPHASSNILRRGVLQAYKFLLANSLPKTASWRIPLDDTIEVDLVHAA